MGRPKGSKNKLKEPAVIKCICNDDALTKTAHWWSIGEWIHNHPGRDRSEYIKYRNNIKRYNKSFFGFSGYYISYVKYPDKICCRLFATVINKL